MALLKASGIRYADAERRLPIPGRFVTVDMFGLCDLLTIQGSTFVGIQCTSGSNHADHVKKALAAEALPDFLGAAKFEIHSWSKRVAYKKDGTKAKLPKWTLRIQQISLMDGKPLVLPSFLANSETERKT